MVRRLSASATRSAAAPSGRLWNLVTDLNRYDEWLEVHDHWIGEVPDRPHVGTKVRAQLTVFAMTHPVEWAVVACARPSTFTLVGRLGLAGAEIGLTATIKPTSVATSDVTLRAWAEGDALHDAGGSALRRGVTEHLETAVGRLIELSTDPLLLA